MKIAFGDFSAKVGRENVFKPRIGNKSLHEISNDSGIRVVNFATPKNLVVQSTTLSEDRKNCSIKIANKSFEDVAKFIYLRKH
jgi:hypothetical protein